MTKTTPPTIPPIAPGPRAVYLTTTGAAVVTTVPSTAVALIVEEITIRVDSEVRVIEVAAAAVDVTTATDEDARTCVVDSCGLFKYVVGPTKTSWSLGRYGSHSHGMLSQPDLPTRRHESSQFFRNTVNVSTLPFTLTQSSLAVRTLAAMSVGTLLQQAVAREQGVGAEVVVDLTDAAKVLLAETLGGALVRDLLALAGLSRSIHV